MIVSFERIEEHALRLLPRIIFGFAKTIHGRTHVLLRLRARQAGDAHHQQPRTLESPGVHWSNSEE
jgi:hypothetical protein